MFWQDEAEAETEPAVPQDIFDLMFKISGTRLATDHAFALSVALRDILGSEICQRIGVHQIRMAESGNGWTRPQDSMVLARRARLVIRVSQSDHAALLALVDQTLTLAGHAIEVGNSSVRKLSTLDTLFAHALVCDATQSEQEFLAQVALGMDALGISVKKMICGSSGLIRSDASELFTRSLLVASLKAEESIALQRAGLGDHQLLGCGIFVPHKGIDAVYPAQRQ